MNTSAIAKYPNHFGLDENWHIVMTEKELDAKHFYADGYIKFIDSLNGVCTRSVLRNTVGDTRINLINVVYKTENGGYTWEKSSLDTTAGARLNGGMDYYDKNTVFYMGGCDTSKYIYPEYDWSAIYKSTDGGYNFKEILMPFIDDPKNIKVYDKDTIFACFKRYILKSTDGGETWNSIFHLIRERAINTGHNLLSFQGLEIADDKTIFLFTDHSYGHDQMFRSSDGGCTWEMIPLPQFTHDVRVVNKDTMIVVGWDPEDQNSWVFRVSDDCKKVDTLLYYDTLRQLKGFLGICNNKEMIINFGNPTAYTKDGGKTWEKIIDMKARNFKRGGFFKSVWSKPEHPFLLALWDSDIVMYDPNFNENYQKAVGVADDINNFNTRLYPNPVNSNSILYINIENDKLRNIRISTFDTQGIKIDESNEKSIPKGLYSFTFSPNKLTTGTYFIVIESAGKVIAREKFVVR
jgi:hypothetical protein